MVQKRSSGAHQILFSHQNLSKPLAGRCSRFLYSLHEQVDFVVARRPPARDDSHMDSMQHFNRSAGGVIKTIQWSLYASIMDDQYMMRYSTDSLAWTKLVIVLLGPGRMRLYL